MYSLFLVLCVALVILSPLVVELWLSAYEYRAERRQANQARITTRPKVSLASVRMP